MHPIRYNMLKELANRIEQLRTKELVRIISEIFDEHRYLLVELQKDQLYAGRNAKDRELNPTYYNDPYFKTPAAAARYAKWKSSLNVRTHNPIFPQKQYETPNLIITGTLIYDTIFAKVSNGILEMSANSSILSELEQKYDEPFGLGKTAFEEFVRQTDMIEKVKQKVKKYLWSLLLMNLFPMLK